MDLTRIQKVMFVIMFSMAWGHQSLAKSVTCSPGRVATKKTDHHSLLAWTDLVKRQHVLCWVRVIVHPEGNGHVTRQIAWAFVAPEGAQRWPVGVVGLGKNGPEKLGNVVALRNVRPPRRSPVFNVCPRAHSFAEMKPMDQGLHPVVVLLEPGVFARGSPRQEPGRFRNETLHTVALTRPFG